MIPLITDNMVFLAQISCTINMVGFCDSLALSLNEHTINHVVYFDFAKAFDNLSIMAFFLKNSRMSISLMGLYSISLIAIFMIGSESSICIK